MTQKIIFMKNIKTVFYENLKELNKEFFPDFRKSFDDFLNSGWYILGDAVRNFEKKIFLNLIIPTILLV